MLGVKLAQRAKGTDRSNTSMNVKTKHRFGREGPPSDLHSMLTTLVLMLAMFDDVQQGEQGACASRD